MQVDGIEMLIPDWEYLERQILQLLYGEGSWGAEEPISEELRDATDNTALNIATHTDGGSSPQGEGVTQNDSTGQNDGAER